MKVYFDIEQGSLDWFQLKYGKIGGTRAKGLFVKSDTLLLELLAELTEDFDEDIALDGFQSDAMERGSELEPQARLELEKYTGYKFLQAGWIESDNNLTGVSPDGITEDLKVGCEIKCPGAKKHLENCLNDVVPYEHVHQCVHNFEVNDKLEKLYFMSYRPESIKPIFVKEITKETLLNIGTKARPVMKTVSDILVMEKSEIKKLEIEIKETINKLKF